MNGIEYYPGTSEQEFNGVNISVSSLANNCCVNLVNYSTDCCGCCFQACLQECTWMWEWKRNVLADGWISYIQVTATYLHINYLIKNFKCHNIYMSFIFIFIFTKYMASTLTSVSKIGHTFFF